MGKIEPAESYPTGLVFSAQRGNAVRLNVAGSDSSQQHGGRGKLPVDFVPGSWGGAGPRVPTQDMVEVDRVDGDVDRSRKGSEACVNT